MTARFRWVLQFPELPALAMLSRILEPELMDTPEEASSYDAMDHGEVNRVFVQDLLAAAAPLLASQRMDDVGDERRGPEYIDVLDLGTGTALQPILLCQECDAVRVMATDAAVCMLEVARFNYESAGRPERIQLEYADAKSLPFADGMFAITMSNSIVHHIAQPLTVLREAVRVTARGGLVFFRDLSRPRDERSLEQLVATYAGEANSLQQSLFRNSLRAALSLEEMQQLVAQLGFRAASVAQTSDLHWTWTASL